MMLMLFTFPHRNHASMRHFAFNVLELYGGVIDTEALVQAVFHIAQDALAD